MNSQINMAIQVLPKSGSIHPYKIVDIAINTIKESGVKYLVCPFETVMEGDYNKLMEIVKKIHEDCYMAGAEEIICNIKIQSNKTEQVTIGSKMEKYWQNQE